VTIALVPANGGADAAAVASLAADLRWALSGFGPTLWLDEAAARGVFTVGPPSQFSTLPEMAVNASRI
jgi:hypothetical protein